WCIYAARASNAQLPTSPPQIIGGRNCGSYNHCTTSTRFLTADDDDADSANLLLFLYATETQIKMGDLSKSGTFIIFPSAFLKNANVFLYEENISSEHTTYNRENQFNDGNYTHLQINLVYTMDSTESLLQLNALNQSRLMFQLNIRLTETRGLSLSDDPQEGQNQSWAGEGFLANFMEIN
ncbi:hypothetical protein CSKR_104001, partial [Clonorchis sinensis]